MSLYNQIKSHFTLPTAYEDWAEYREQLTSYLIAQMNQVSLPLCFSANTNIDDILPTIAIIGAGACNDIDLSALLPHFSKITLIDYDTDALTSAVETYNIAGSSKIERVTFSLNGRDDSHYLDFCNQLQNYIQCLSGVFTPEEFESFAISKVMEYINETKDYFIPLQTHSYDYICCFGVHSQLQAMFSYIYHVFEVNLTDMYFTNTPEFNSRFTQCLRNENSRFIPHFHDTLFTCAKKAVFLGLERKCNHADGPVEGAYQAFEDIRNRNLNIQEETLVWPFLPSAGISYEMSILRISIS